MRSIATQLTWTNALLVSSCASFLRSPRVHAGRHKCRDVYKHAPVPSPCASPRRCAVAVRRGALLRRAPPEGCRPCCTCLPPLCSARSWAAMWRCRRRCSGASTTRARRSGQTGAHNPKLRRMRPMPATRRAPPAVAARMTRALLTLLLLSGAGDCQRLTCCLAARPILQSQRGALRHSQRRCVATRGTRASPPSTCWCAPPARHVSSVPPHPLGRPSFPLTPLTRARLRRAALRRLRRRRCGGHVPWRQRADVAAALRHPFRAALLSMRLPAAAERA
jgi:hypothetical protein